MITADFLSGTSLPPITPPTGNAYVPVCYARLLVCNTPRVVCNICVLLCYSMSCHVMY